jgi:chromosome segregation ATPase
MNSDQVATYMTQAALVLFSAGAFWGYVKERRVNKAKGAVATATVELQIDNTRMQNLEQRLGLAQKAWDQERESFQRRIAHLEDELANERAEAAEEKMRHDQQLSELEGRLGVMQRELSDLYRELTELRQRNGGHTPPASATTDPSP